MYEFRLSAKNGIDFGDQASTSLLTTDGSESMTPYVTSRDRKWRASYIRDVFCVVWRKC